MPFSYQKTFNCTTKPVNIEPGFMTDTFNTGFTVKHFNKMKTHL